MERYISNVIKPEDIVVETSNCYVDGVRQDTVYVKYVPLDIGTWETSEVGQVDAFNSCIRKLEFRIKFGEFKDYYDSNPDAFVEEFLGLELKWYQRAIVKMMLRG